MLVVAFAVVVAASPPSAGVCIRQALDAIGPDVEERAYAAHRFVIRGESYEPGQNVDPASQESRRVSTWILAADEGPSSTTMRWAIDTTYPIAWHYEYVERFPTLRARALGAGAVDGRDGFREPSSHSMSVARVAARRLMLWLDSPERVLTAFGEKRVEGRCQRIIANDVRVDLDPETHLPLSATIDEEDPLLGVVDHRVDYDDWRDVGGMRAPFHVEHRIGGKIVVVEQRDSVAVAPPRFSMLDVGVDWKHARVEGRLVDHQLAFHLPGADSSWDFGERANVGHREALWLTRMLAMGAPPDPQLRGAFKFVDVAPGVVHARGADDNALIVDAGDHTVVVDAPIGAGASRSIYEYARTRFPMKRVVVVLTHLHHDHIAGARFWAERGAGFVVGGGVAEPLRAWLRDLEPQVDEASRADVVGGGVELIPVENTHAKGMLAVYLPKWRTLYVADLYNPGEPLVAFPASLVVFPAMRALYPDVLAKLAEWAHPVATTIDERRLAVDRVLGAHGKIVGHVEDVRALAAQ